MLAGHAVRPRKRRRGSVRGCAVARGPRPRCILRTPRQSELRGDRDAGSEVGNSAVPVLQGRGQSGRGPLQALPSRDPADKPRPRRSVLSVRKRSTSRPSGAGTARPIAPRVRDDCVVCLDVRCPLRPHSSREGYVREGYGHARTSVQDRLMKGARTSIPMTREHGVSWSPASTTASTSCVSPLPSVLTPSSSSVPAPASR